MNLKIKILTSNKNSQKNLKLNKPVFELKKDNWKTSESSKKKLKKYRHNPEKILEKFKKVHKKKYDYSKVNYIGLTKNIIIICKKHGEFKTTPKLHLGRDSKNLYKKKDPIGCGSCILDDIIIDFQKVHGKIYDYSKIEFKYKSYPIIIICPEHGEFKQTLAKHMNGSLCPLCKIIQTK